MLLNVTDGLYLTLPNSLAAGVGRHDCPSAERGRCAVGRAVSLIAETLALDPVAR